MSFLTPRPRTNRRETASRVADGCGTASTVNYDDQPYDVQLQYARGGGRNLEARGHDGGRECVVVQQQNEGVAEMGGFVLQEGRDVSEESNDEKKTIFCEETTNEGQALTTHGGRGVRGEQWEDGADEARAVDELLLQLVVLLASHDVLSAQDDELVHLDAQSRNRNQRVALPLNQPVIHSQGCPRNRHTRRTCLRHCTGCFLCWEPSSHASG